MDSRPVDLTTFRTTVALWCGADQIDLQEVTLPRPGPGEVLVRIRLATVCGSDRHTVAGRRASPRPGVLGHEAVGEVVALANGAPASTTIGDPLNLGDRIVWGVAVSCGQCDRCRAGRTAKCRRLRKVGHEAFDSAWPLSGTYAQHVLLPRGAAVVGVPSGLPDAAAAPASCATATVMAVVERAGDLIEQRVLVTGAGMLGLTAAAAARYAGAATVTVTDRDPDRLALAEKFGAHQAVAPGDPLPEVDVVLELTGSTQVTSAALAALDVGGVLVLAGAVSPTAPLPLDPEQVVRRWQTIAGVHNYEPHHLAAGIRFLEETAADFPWPDLVAPPEPLDRLVDLLTESAIGAPRAAVAP